MNTFKICTVENCESEVKAKGLCYKHYVKERRKRPEVIEKLKDYAKTKQKEAQKRYLDRKFPNRKHKILNKDKKCECGKVVVAKGLCSNCYQKERIKSGKVDAKKYYGKYNKKLNLNIYNDEIFYKVLDNVKQGLSIKDSCKVVKINTTIFYKCITEEQKKELKVQKLLFRFNNTKYYISKYKE